MGGVIMKKYFFISFKSFKEEREVGVGWFVVVCSCSFKRIYESLLSHYNEHADYKADNAIVTSITVLDKQTAAQLSNNFTEFALIIDDGEKEEENKIEDVNLLLARDKNNRLFLYIDKNGPKRGYDYWSCDDGECMELDYSLFPEVQWSDEEPTKVKLVIK